MRIEIEQNACRNNTWISVFCNEIKIIDLVKQIKTSRKAFCEQIRLMALLNNGRF